MLKNKLKIKIQIIASIIKDQKVFYIFIPYTMTWITEISLTCLLYILLLIKLIFFGNTNYFNKITEILVDIHIMVFA